MAAQARFHQRIIRILLAAILILAAALRLWRLGAISFTYDAAAVSNLAAALVDRGQVPLQGMISSAGIRNPALGVYLISLPVLVSRDPAVLAGFVALLNVASVLGAYWLGRRYWSVWVGLLAALLFAASPWAVQHSRGILGQDLLIPGVVLFFVFLFAWLVDGKLWALPAAVVTLAALLQVHFAALAFVPLLGILLLWQIAACLRRRTCGRLLTYLAVGLALGALLYLPYVIAEARNGWENAQRLLAMGAQPYRLYPQIPDLALMAVGGRNIHSLAGPRSYQAYLAGLVDRGFRLDRLEEWLVVAVVVYLAVRWVQRRKDERLLKRDGLLLLWLLAPLVFFTVSKSEVYPHYLVVIYPAPYLALGAAVQDVYTALAGHRRARAALAAVAVTLAAAVVVWQVYLVTSIYRFIDLTDTPEGWGTPVRILREVARTTEDLAALNEQANVLMLCPGAEPRWDECPAVFSFLTSRSRNVRFLDYDDPAFRTHQDDPETLVVLAPGDSLAAAELPHLAQPLPDAAVPLRQNQGAYRFFQIRNPYRDVASYLQAVARPEDAIVLVGPDQAEPLAKFYAGPLPVIDLARQPVEPEATVRELEQLAAQHPRLHVLYRAAEESDPQGMVENWLDRHTFAGAGQWLGPVRVVTYAAPTSADSWPARGESTVFGGQIRLLRIAQSGQTVEAGDMLQLRLDWQAEGEPDADYTLFVQLLDQDGQVRAQRDLPLLAGGLPTSAWQAQQAATSLVGLGVRAGTPPGPYHLVLGLYNAAAGRRLPAGTEDHLDLGAVEVERSSRPAETAWPGMRYRPNLAFSEVTLLGHDRYKRGFAHAPDTPVSPGDALQLVFQWRADVQPAQDWMVSFRLVDQGGKAVAAGTAPLADQRYPTSQWLAGETVRGEHVLAIPAAAAPGRYRLQIAVHPAGSSGRTGRWTDLGPVVVS